MLFIGGGGASKCLEPALTEIRACAMKVVFVTIATVCSTIQQCKLFDFSFFFFKFRRFELKVGAVVYVIHVIHNYCDESDNSIFSVFLHFQHIRNTTKIEWVHILK